MLEITKDGPSKTQIMYKASLSFSQLNDYLAFLLHSKLIEQVNVAGVEVYIITDKGSDFLQRHNELTKMLKSTKNIIDLLVPIGVPQGS
jgi:predicted transcriptional regulator